MSIKVAEMFAGVGGFRVGLEGYGGEGMEKPAAGDFETVWANQWEPDGSERKQFAWRCYESRFGAGSCVNEDVAKVLDEAEAGDREIPDFDMLVGGFPCFVAGTRVLTDAGLRPIEEIRPGDVVVTHTGGRRPVLEVGRTKNSPLVMVMVDGAPSIVCTPDHPFFARDAGAPDSEGDSVVPAWHLCNKRYYVRCLLTYSGDYKDRDEDSFVHGGFLYRRVRHVDMLPRREDVYNMEVEGDHSYVVEGVCVHNCQSYSVARPLSQSKGIEGDKGVLWWSIYRMLKLKQPRVCLFENVDRLLKSPSSQRGRDFAIILSCLHRLGYSVEWMVINAADYGMPQKRRRTYIYAERGAGEWDLADRLESSGVMQEAFPFKADAGARRRELSVGDDPYETTQTFGKGCKTSPFESAGVMQGGRILTAKAYPVYDGPRAVLADLLSDPSDVPGQFYVPDDKLGQWRYTRESKTIPRTSKDGHTYMYSEGAMSFPDPTDKPARTILTGESGAGASRMKHIIEEPGTGRYRRLVPDELDQIQTFPKGWTDGCGMSDAQRAFCMGNALVTEIPHRIGKAIARREALRGGESGGGES